MSRMEPLLFLLAPCVKEEILTTAKTTIVDVAGRLSYKVTHLVEIFNEDQHETIDVATYFPPTMVILKTSCRCHSRAI